MRLYTQLSVSKGEAFLLLEYSQGKNFLETICFVSPRDSVRTHSSVHEQCFSCMLCKMYLAMAVQPTECGQVLHFKHTVISGVIVPLYCPSCTHVISQKI